VSPPWVYKPRSATAMRGISVSRFAFREHTTGGLRPPLLCTVYRRSVAGAGGHQSAARFVIHGGLTPPALVHRVPQTAGRRRWTSIRGSFRFPRGLTPPALALRCECLPAKNDFFDAQTHTEKGAADVSPPWLGEPNAVPRKSNIVQRLANRQPGAAGVSPPWVRKPRLQRQCAGFP
jgi:hypothetical protein